MITRTRPARRTLRSMATALAVAVAATAGTALLPGVAQAADYTSPVDPTVTYSVPTEVEAGTAIVVSGAGWTAAAGGGSIIAVKLDDGGVQTTASVTHPVTDAVQADTSIVALVQADASGAWTLSVPFPTSANSDASWAAGQTHSVRLLTGSMLAGDTIRSLGAQFTVTDGATDPTDPGTPGGFTFDVQRLDLGVGQYQIAYSARNDVFWVSQTSALLKVDPVTLEILACYEVLGAGTPDEESVFGLDVDDVTNTVWVTSTPLNRVAVYDQSTGAHLASFPDVDHGRDVEVDEAGNTVYVSSVNGRAVARFDATTHERLPDIPIDGQPMALALDEAGGRLYTSTLDTARLAIIDTATGAVAHHPLPGAARSSAVAVFPQLQRVYVGNQDSADVTVLDSVTGAFVTSIPTGAGTLSLAVDEENGLVYAANFFANTISIIDTATNTVVHTVADTAVSPNHVTVVDGVAYVVDKASLSGAAGDAIIRITPTSVPTDPTDPGEGSAGITVTADVPAGGGEDGPLSLSVDAGAVVALAAQSGPGDRLSFAGELPVVRVTDARSEESAAGGGWSLSGRSSAFVSGAGELSAGYLGWEPEVRTPRPGLSAGAAVTGSLDGGPGLASAAELASASAAGRAGSAEVGAGLELAVPVGTPAGSYSATMTVSLFPTD